jgi:hypothetical protein
MVLRNIVASTHTDTTLVVLGCHDWLIARKIVTTKNVWASILPFSLAIIILCLFFASSPFQETILPLSHSFWMMNLGLTGACLCHIVVIPFSQ